MIDTSRSMSYHIGNLNTENERINYQMATGTKIDQGSDDAVLYADLIDIEEKLRVTQGLETQIVKTKAVNETSDQNLGDMKESLDSIKVDLLKGLNDGMDRTDKTALATNLKGIRADMVDRMNTRVDDEYVFSGSDTTKRTLEKDPNFDLNGKITYEGDGFLREVAVQPGSYRDRGVTAYDASFYTSSSALAGDSFTFSAGERIIDDEGFEWKLNNAKDQLQKYDHNGNIYHPLEDGVTQIAIDSSTAAIEADTTQQAVQETYTINAIPAVPEGRVFEAKHNYFDDLNVIINALEGQSTKLDGTTGGVIDDDLVRETLSTGLDQTTQQYNATNVGHSELGGRNNVFNVAYDRLLTEETHYNILLQERGAADLAQLSMESKALELTYQALYSTIAKMNDLSLVNYLR